VTTSWIKPLEVPCGEQFQDDVVASHHYMECDECDRIHKARNFRPIREPVEPPQAPRLLPWRR
jgi:hypothetical protein